MKRIKKLVSILTLIIIFVSLTKNIALGATPIKFANLIKGASIKTNVQFNDGKTQPFELQANYIYYSNNGKEYPAYCVTHRFRWS